MFTFFKLYSAEYSSLIVNYRRPNKIFGDICYHCYIRESITTREGFALLHTGRSNQAQYLAALKRLLDKRSCRKRKSEKKYVELIKETTNSTMNSRVQVDMLRGPQLAALTSQLCTRVNTHGLHTSARLLSSCDAVRHFDPVSSLPNNIPQDHSLIINSPNTCSQPYKNSNNLNLEIRHYLVSDLLTSLQSSVPDIVSSFKKLSKSGENSVNVNLPNVESESYLKDNYYRRPVIHDLSAIPSIVNSDVQKLQKELRKKIRLKSAAAVRLEEDEKTMLTSFNNKIENSDDLETIALVNEEVENCNPKPKPKKKASYNVNLKKKIREAVAKQNISDLERKNKENSLNANFLSYCDVCVNTGNANGAFYAIKAYRNKILIRKEWYPKISDIAIYNILLASYSKEGNWKRISDLLSFALEDNVELDRQTYACVLECLGRRRLKDVELIKYYLNELSVKGFDVNEVLNNTSLSLESFEKVMEAIRRVSPTFSWKQSLPDLDYSCSLLHNLNEMKTDYKSPAPPTINSDLLKQLYFEQLQTEKDNYVKIKTIEKRPEDGINVEVYRHRLQQMEKTWKEIVEKAFDRDMELLKAQSRHRSHFFFTIYPYLMTIPKEDHVEIMLQEIRKLAEGSETYSPTTKQLYRGLGTQVCLRYQIRKKVDSGLLKLLDEMMSKYSDWYTNPNIYSVNSRQKWLQILHDLPEAKQLFKDDPLWKSNVLIGVGRFLYNIIIRDIKVNVNAMKISTQQKEHLLPAFYILFRNKGHSCKEEVKPHPTLSRLFRASAPEHLVFEASKIPMVCPPLPWHSISSGGFLVTKTELIRLPYQAIAQWKALEKTPVNNLYPAFDSLNQLGAVPWSVNEAVLDVILEVFNSGGSSRLDVPEPPNACPAAEPLSADMTQQQRYQNFRQRMAVRRRKAEMYSLWCDALYKLSLANHFRKRVFWLPHNMDFRGRVYPVAPHLNHLGSDLSRSLLVFAKGEPLGPNGFDWLKIHTINLTGTHKKQSVEARLTYANEILEDILDSAERPLTGKMWWANSEEPWQTLAACIEVRNAYNSGDPASYISCFPVHQDGSCNGLQHYAALGRDRAGGESVNLTPAAIPQDVYSCVAAIVERERVKDAANGLKIAQVLDGFIYRKVIKQTVMTTVYGVTRYGARLQIARQLKDLDEFPKQHVWQASMYLVSKTFESLQEMFTSTKEIQDWFTECARLIAQVCGENVEWVTPLGLPIVQPYSKTQQSSSSSHLKFIGVQSGTLADAFDRPNIMKQKNAFAPNFIHSLDSSHMMLTSLMCERAGVTFVSVHDCYWTHACSVPVMNRICRDQFVSLHSQPILSNLSNYFVNRFAYLESTFQNDGSVADLAKRNLNRALKDLPSTGSLELNSVLKSPYFFS